MTLLFANNAYGTLAGPITNTATSANLAAGTGALFPNPTAPDYFKMTFVDAATGLVSEIVHVTARINDNITIVRGREGTTAQNWLAGDLAQNLWTAGSAQAMLQSQQQSGFYQGTDTASDPNNMTVPTFVPALSAPPVAGQIYFVTKGNNPNTGSVKLLGGTGATAGTSQPVVYGDGAQLALGDWPGSASAWLYYTGSVYQLLGLVRSLTAIGLPSATGPIQYTTPGTYTYTPSAGTRAYTVEVQAGGGSGGGTNNPGAGGVSVGVSAGGGAYAKKTFLVSAAPTGTIVLGAAGAAAAAGANGNNAATCSFTCAAGTVTCTGGTGGTNPGTYAAFPQITTTAAGGLATGGDENIPGESSQASLVLSASQALVGPAGGCFLGTGGLQYAVSHNGTPGVGFGAGGTAGLAYAGAGQYSGGAGAPPIIYITEIK